MLIAQQRIQTTRLDLTPLCEEEFGQIFTIAQDKQSIEDFQMQALTLEDVLKWLEPALAEPMSLNWTIRRNQAVIGLIELYLGPEFSSKEIEGICRVGYFIAANAQGQGFGTEALSGVVSWTLGHNEITRIEAGVTLRNIASWRILEKVGFQRDHIVSNNWKWRGEMLDSAYYFIEKERQYLLDLGERW